MFDTAISPVISWWRFVFSPLSLIREGLHNSDEDVGHIIRNYWAFPILLVVVTNGLALHFYGIELKSEPLLAVAYLTFAGLNIILDAFIFFVVLRFCGVAVSQRMAFLCFSIMAVYTPLFSWTNIPSTVHTFDLVSYLKAQHLSFNDAISFWFAQTKEINEKLSTPVPMLAPYLSSASAAVYLLSTTLVQSA